MSNNQLHVPYSSRIRSKLALLDTFVEVYLCGISCHRPPAAPAKRCRSPMLDCGPDTSASFKKLIAEFAGIPVSGELHTLRAAASNLKRFGF